MTSPNIPQLTPANDSDRFRDIDENDLSPTDYYMLLQALVAAIVELQALIVQLRMEIDTWNPDRPYQYDLLSDIGVCFTDYRIAIAHPELFSQLL